MTRISDELREFADAEVLSAIQISDLKHMADRIDAEMVELPKDKDGVIHVGDTVYDESGVACEVVSIGYGRWPGGMAVHAMDGSSNWRNLMPERLTHERHDSLERPDSWESIADELEAWCDSVDVDGDACDEPRDLADRIRRLAAKEDRQ